MHIGSGTDLEHLRQVCGAMGQAALEVGRRPRSISAGGGLPVPYRDGESYVDLAAYYSLWDDVRRTARRVVRASCRLEIEPGRYLVAESGYLVSEIRAVKRTGNNTFYLLDAGFNNLARPILYGSYHPMSIVPASGQVRKPARAGRRRRRAAVRVGRYLHARGRRLRLHAVSARREVGDFLVLEVAGAYGFVMGSNYNSKPLAPEIRHFGWFPTYLVRTRQTFEDLIRGESIPLVVRQGCQVTSRSTSCS